MNKTFDAGARIHSLFAGACSVLQSPLLLAIRLYWGWQFFQTGLGKLRHIEKVIDFFTSLGIPFPAFNAYFVSSLECVGGVLLMIGLGSRLIALPLFADMVVAYITADRAALLSIFSDPGKFYASDAYTFLFASLVILVFGPGKISLDHAIAYRTGKKAADQSTLRGQTVPSGGLSEASIKSK